MDALIAVGAGILAGMLTGLVPGLHVNLLAAMALLAPMGPEAGLGLVAVGVVHTFVSVLPTTYLGVPDGGSLSVLPAHRLRQEGAAREAVQISLHASMLALLLSAILVVPYQAWLSQPAVRPFLRMVAPWALLAVPSWLALRDRRRWAAASCALGAGALGWVAFDWPVAGWLPGAATPLLPLLSGLFGAPTLWWAMRARQRHVPTAPAPRSMPRGTHVAGVRGTAMASITAVMPGLTSAVATSLAIPGKDLDARRVLATMSAVNTAHLCLALAVLWITGQTRSGLAIAWTDHRAPLPWASAPPPDLLLVLGTCLLAGAAAVLATPRIEPAYERLLGRLPPGRAEAATLALVATLVVVTTGWTGALLFLAACYVGSMPLRLGVARVHLAAALSIPIGLKLAGL